MDRGREYMRRMGEIGRIREVSIEEERRRVMDGDLEVISHG